MIFRFYRKLGKPVAQITAETKPNINTTISEDASIGLLTTLNLSIGCRVMLRKNLWLNGKLVNGSIGTVRAIVYKKDVRPADLPLYVLVELDEYRKLGIHDNLFPIVPITKTFIHKGLKCFRKQLPLILGHAFTIHKAQGLTLEKVYIFT